METRNPVLSREFKAGPGGYATFQEGAAATDAATLQNMYDGVGTAENRMTLDDVVVKTGILFVILLVGATVGWNVVATAPWVYWVSLIAAFALGMVIAIRRTTNPPLIMLYAAVEGVFVGGISRFYNEAFNGVVLQAVTGTLVAFGVMLVLFKSGRLRATPRFQKMMMGAMLSYLLIAVVSLISAFFGVGGGWGFYGVGGLGILLCAVGVALAAFSLVLDFEAISVGVREGYPEKEAWRAGFGLMVTLVWLYLELLRMLAILQGRN